MNGEFVVFGITAVFFATVVLVLFYFVCDAAGTESVRDVFSAFLIGGLFLVWAFPIVYGASQGWYWLENGEFRPVNLCIDADFLCGDSESMKGLAKIFQLLASSPFFTLMMVAVGSQSCLQWLLDDIDQKRNADRQLREDRRDDVDDWYEDQ